MQNRSSDYLPALFERTTPFHLRHNLRAEPIQLTVLDFSYLHYHSTLELGVCVRGSGVCRVQGAQQAFRAGDVQVIFPYQSHLSRCDHGAAAYWRWLDVDLPSLFARCDMGSAARFEQMMLTQMAFAGIFSPNADENTARLVRAVLDEAAGDAPERETLCCAYLCQLLIHLARKSRSLPKLENQSAPGLRRLAPAMERIHADAGCGARSRVSELAQACGLSLAQFRRVFLATTGVSPQAYVIGCNMRRAQRLLLTTDRTVLDIALETGFEDPCAFGRRFKRLFGVPPSRWRAGQTVAVAQ